MNPENGNLMQQDDRRYRRALPPQPFELERRNIPVTAEFTECIRNMDRHLPLSDWVVDENSSGGGDACAFWIREIVINHYDISSYDYNHHPWIKEEVDTVSKIIRHTYLSSPCYRTMRAQCTRQLLLTLLWVSPRNPGDRVHGWIMHALCNFFNLPTEDRNNIIALGRSLNGYNHIPPSDNGVIYMRSPDSLFRTSYRKYKCDQLSEKDELSFHVEPREGSEDGSFHGELIDMTGNDIVIDMTQVLSSPEPSSSEDSDESTS